MGIMDQNASTVTEALTALSNFSIDAYDQCPSHLHLLNPTHLARYVSFRQALGDRIRTSIGADALRAVAMFEMDRPETVDTLPIYYENTHAIIEPATAIAHLVQGRDDPSVWMSWNFDKDCQLLDRARTELDGIINIPETTEDLQPIARCIGRLSAFLEQRENRAWLEPRGQRIRYSGRRGKQGNSEAYARWNAVLRWVEDARR